MAIYSVKMLSSQHIIYMTRYRVLKSGTPEQPPRSPAAAAHSEGRQDPGEEQHAEPREGLGLPRHLPPLGLQKKGVKSAT